MVDKANERTWATNTLFGLVNCLKENFMLRNLVITLIFPPT
jgi:hypothetical protein